MNCSQRAGFSTRDLLICVATAAILASYLAVYVQKTRVRVVRSHCVSNLKQVGLGFRMWSNDHSERFPWDVPAAEGGTMELAQLPSAAPHYLAVSNEFNSPRILKCPQDTERTWTNRWNASLHLSLSYFAVLNAGETKPATMLAGDRNVSTNSFPMAGLLTVRNVNELQVTPGLHQTYVNVALADGSVAQLKPVDLCKAARAEMTALSNQPVRLVIP